MRPKRRGRSGGTARSRRTIASRSSRSASVLIARESDRTSSAQRGRSAEIADQQVAQHADPTLRLGIPGKDADRAGAAVDLDPATAVADLAAHAIVADLVRL